MSGGRPAGLQGTLNYSRLRFRGHQYAKAKSKVDRSILIKNPRSPVISYSCVPHSVGKEFGTGGEPVRHRLRTGGTPNDCDVRGTAYIRFGRLAVSMSHLLFRFSACK